MNSACRTCVLPRASPLRTQRPCPGLAVACCSLPFSNTSASLPAHPSGLSSRRDRSAGVKRSRAARIRGFDAHDAEIDDARGYRSPAAQTISKTLPVAALVRTPFPECRRCRRWKSPTTSACTSYNIHTACHSRQSTRGTEEGGERERCRVLRIERRTRPPSSRRRAVVDSALSAVGVPPLLWMNVAEDVRRQRDLNDDSAAS